MRQTTKMIAMAVAAFTIVSCSNNNPIAKQPDLQLRLDGAPLTRYNGNGFNESDVIGVYVVKRNTSEANDLLQNGNYVDNSRFIYTKVGDYYTPYFIPEAGN